MSQEVKELKKQMIREVVKELRELWSDYIEPHYPAGLTSTRRFHESYTECQAQMMRIVDETHKDIVSLKENQKVKCSRCNSNNINIVSRPMKCIDCMYVFNEVRD